MKAKNDLRAQLRRQWRAACDNYFDEVVGESDPDRRFRRLRDLGAISVRLHLFEQGRRSKR